MQRCTAGYMDAWSGAAVIGIAMTALASAAEAQVGRISGTVLSTEDAAPVIGARVTVLGANVITITREDGRYTLTVNPGTYSLVSVRIGFAPDTVTGVVVRSNEVTSANLTLAPSLAQLGSVLVTGYGVTRSEADRTGVAQTVSEREFNTGRITRPEDLLQSKVAGVQIVDNNEPGAGVSIRVRGGTSISSSNEPLFVLDGVPIIEGNGVGSGRNPLNFINPGDIESITVLKDASATAIYGSRGANGVVMITTKSGAEGTLVTYGSSASNSVVVRNPDLLSAAEFRAAVTEYAPNNVAGLGSANTDWREAVQRSGFGQQHDLAVAGTRDEMRYRLSLGLLDQDGVLRGTNTQRLSASIAYSDRLFGDQLELKTNVKGSRTTDLFTPGGVIGSSTSFAPTQPINRDDGTFFEWNDPLGPNNPLADLRLVQDRGTAFRSIGSIEARYLIPVISGLSATLRTGYDVSQGERTFFSPSVAREEVETGRGGRFNRSNPRQVNTLLEVFSNYQRRVESLASDMDFTVGYTYEDRSGDFPSFYAEGLSSDLLGQSGVPTSTLQQNFLDIQESRLISGLARVNWTMNDRYLLTASVRRDGSSRFGPANQWGVFPSAAFAWRVSQENFMMDQGLFSDLKLRVSWGVNGNQAFGNYQAYPTYSIGGVRAQAQFGNDFVATIRPSAVDPNIKWEQTTSTNYGVDWGIMRNRITGSVEYYTKTTDDLIFTVPVAAGTNLSNFVTTNIGSMRNNGVEFSLNAALFTGGTDGFRWDANFNAASNTNRLLRVNVIGSGDEQILVGGIAGGVGSTIQVLQPGFPVNSYFVYRHLRGSDGRPIYDDTNGDGTINEADLYEDLNGDGAINQDDRAPFRNPAPRWILGHTSIFGWKRVDASLTARAYLGNYIYNNVASNLGHYSAVRGAAPANLHGSVRDNGFVNPQYFSDVYIEDASFLRLDNLTVGYTIGALRSVSQLRIFGTVQNLFTLTPYSGVDPVAGINGIDNNIFPLARTFTTGINVTF